MQSAESKYKKEQDQFKQDIQKLEELKDQNGV